jgi:hypothetical protein
MDSQPHDMIMKSIACRIYFNLKLSQPWTANATGYQATIKPQFRTLRFPAKPLPQTLASASQAKIYLHLEYLLIKLLAIATCYPGRPPGAFFATAPGSEEALCYWDPHEMKMETKYPVI